MNSLREHDRVVLLTDVPRDELRAGSTGTIVHVHDAGAAYEVEFVGRDNRVVTLENKQVRPLVAR